MSEFAKSVGLFAFMLFAGICVFFGLSALNIIHLKLFGPAMEQARYEQFEASQSHIDGVVRQLRDYRVRYAMAPNDEAKAAIRTAVLSEVGTTPMEYLPVDVIIFLRELGR